MLFRLLGTLSAELFCSKNGPTEKQKNITNLTLLAKESGAVTPGPVKSNMTSLLLSSNELPLTKIRQTKVKHLNMTEIEQHVACNKLIYSNQSPYDKERGREN